MTNSVIGALRVVLGLDSAQFTQGLTAAQKELKKTGERFQAIGNSMSGIGAGLSIAITAPVIAFGVAARAAAKESREAFGQVEAALTSMGNASGRTAEQLSAAAAKLQGMSLADDDEILRKVTANLLTFGKVAGESFDRAQLAAVNLSARLGTDLQGSALLVGKALNDPIKGMTALTRAGVSFTEQQKTQIEAMVEAGNLAGAQGAILAELEKQFGGAAQALRDATPEAATIDQWREFQETIGQMVEVTLPPLTNLLGSVLGAFNDLSPGMQEIVVTGAAVAATLGPVVAVLGVITSTVGGAIVAISGMGTTLAAAGGAAGIFAAAVTALTGPIGLLALAIGGVVTVLALMAAEQAKVDAKNRELTQTMGGAKTALEAYDKAIQDVAQSSGDARKKAIEHANAMRIEAAAAVTAARALREKAIASAEAALQSAEQNRRNSDPRGLAGFAGAWAAAGGGMGGGFGPSPASELDANLQKGAARAQDTAAAARAGLDAATKRLAQSEAKYASILRGDTIPALGAAAGAAEPMAKATSKGTKAAKEASDALKELRADVAAVIDGLKTDNERKIDEISEQMLTLRKGLEAGLVSIEEFNAASDRMFAPQAAKSKLFDPKDLKQPAEEAAKVWGEHLADQEEALDASLDRMGTSFRGFFQGWIASGKADWKRLLLDLTSDWKNTMSVLSRLSGGLGTGLSKVLSSVGGAFQGMAIGQGMGLGSGMAGVDMGASIGGSIAGGLLASSGFAGTIGAGIANGVVGLGGSAALAGSLGTLLSSAAVLGPIGAIAGIALAGFFKQKPSNNGAIASIDGDRFSLAGNKRTDETSQMATAAAQAIIAGQKALEAAGVTLNATVKTIDIGTRDATDIVLSNGQALTSGVGDAAAAAETALRALLQGATFADEAQKALVTSMVSAGRGFDEIATALSAFGEAQKLPQAIADAIQQLRDPKGFEVTQVRRDQEARRKALQEQLSAGYLTAEQFAAVTAQLQILEGLELDKALGRFTDGLSAVDAARDAVSAAYDREAGVLTGVIERLKSLGSTIRDFGQSLISGPLALLSPRARYDAAKAEYEGVKGRMARGDEDAIAKFPAVAEAFLQASQDFFGSTPEYFADLNGVRADTARTASLTDNLVGHAQAQLDALNKQVDGQIELNKNVVSVKDELVKLAAALAGYAQTTGQKLGLNPSSNAALAAATGYTGDFGTGGFQAWIVQQGETVRATARQILESFGQSYRISGFARGTNSAPGGLSLVGELGPELLNIPRGGQVIPNDILRSLAANDPGNVSTGLRRVEARLVSIEGELQADKTQRAAIAAQQRNQGQQQLAVAESTKRAARSAAAR